MYEIMDKNIFTFLCLKVLSIWTSVKCHNLSYQNIKEMWAILQSFNYFFPLFNKYPQNSRNSKTFYMLMFWKGKFNSFLGSSNFYSAYNLCKQFGPRSEQTECWSWPWIQNVSHWDSIPERIFFFLKSHFEKKVADNNNKSMKNYPS